MIKLILKNSQGIIASGLTILASGCMLLGAVYGFMGSDLTAYRAFIGGCSIGASLVGYYIAARLIGIGG